MSTTSMRAAGAGVGPLRVRSDLRLVVDGVHATVTADGRRVVVDSDDAGLLLVAATRTPTSTNRATSARRLIGRVAQELDDAGVTAALTSRGGTVVEFGNGCNSLLGRVLLGSDRTRLGSSGAVLQLVSGYVRASESVQRRLTAASAGVVIAALLARSGLRRIGRDS